ncbi:MAG: PhoH family protein [Planctomycetota bacterium]
MNRTSDLSALMQPVEAATGDTPAASASPDSGEAPPGAATTTPASAARTSAQAAGGVPRPKTKVKHFVLDTNVLLHDPKALFVFEDNNIIIPFTVLEEIDRFKGDSNSIGRNARETIRYLDVLRETGRLSDGVSLKGCGDRIPAALVTEPTGTLKIVISPEELKRPRAIEHDSPDNRIISVAYHLQLQGEPVVFVSKDINARIKSDALDIRTEDFENQKVDVEKLFTGYESIYVDREVIDELYSERMLALSRLEEARVPTEQDPAPPKVKANGNGNGNGAQGSLALVPNEFVLLIDAMDEGHTGLGRRLADTEHVIPVSAPRKPTFGIMARNVQQTMALDLLLDDEVSFVTLIGSAGTGKTLLAVAAGMQKIFSEERYEKLLVARPIMPLGRDIGYLPGDKDEKLAAWMQPIFDNLTYLLSTRGHPMQSAESHTTEQRVNRLIADGRLVLEPLTYIRGRSIPHQFIIVDEAQNLTPHEVKTIVSRVGEGTKIVFTGDIEQIDNPYLDASSNGLTYAIDRMRGCGVVGHVSLLKSERSELASIATDRL